MGTGERSQPMSSSTAQPATLARLRANAARAGLHLDDEDLARIAAGAFLSNVDNFSRLIERVPSDTIPDFLKAWGDDRPRDAQGVAIGDAGGEAGESDPRDPF